MGACKSTNQITFVVDQLDQLTFIQANLHEIEKSMVRITKAVRIPIREFPTAFMFHDNRKLVERVFYCFVFY